MFYTTVRISTWCALIFLSFGFDSFLKVNVFGVRIHFGVLAILFSILYEIIAYRRIYCLKDFFLKNWPILPFFFYQIFSLLLNNTYQGTFKVALYYFLSVTVFFFFYTKAGLIYGKVIVRFQWILILTGLIQYGLFKFFGYQLSFYKAEHYMVEASFALRMRGFFVEPNWYSIIMSFNTLLLLSELGKSFTKKKILIALSVVCLVLNASYTGVGLIVLILLFEGITNLRTISWKRIFALVLMLGLIAVLLVGRANLSSQVQGRQASEGIAINYGSRFFPVVRTVDYMKDQEWTKKLFGFGIGSWPYYGIYNNLGYAGIFGDYEVKPANRDSAELQVFILELGYLSLLLLFFDHAYHYFKYRRKNLLFSIACAYLAACYLIYPIYNFMIYLVPYYVFRSRVIRGYQ